MMAVAGIFFQEIWHPLLAGDDFETALDQYYGVTEFIPDFGAGAIFVLSLFEFKSIAKGWDPIEETLKDPSKFLVYKRLFLLSCVYFLRSAFLCL